MNRQSAWSGGLLLASWPPGLLAVLASVYAMTDVRAGLYPAREIASASLTYR